MSDPEAISKHFLQSEEASWQETVSQFRLIERKC